MSHLRKVKQVGRKVDFNHCSLDVGSRRGTGHGARDRAARQARHPTEGTKPSGIAGDDKPGLRTVETRMTDNMRFSPDRVQVRQGESIRFVVRNDGRMLHETVIGSKAHLDEHVALMMKFPDMDTTSPIWLMSNPAPTTGSSGTSIARANSNLHA